MSTPISLKDRHAQRREQLQQERTFELAVPGYEDIPLTARYRSLSYQEQRAIGKRYEKATDEIQGELNAAADIITKASTPAIAAPGADEALGLFIKLPDGGVERIGRWDSSTAASQFGVEFAADTSPTARDAIFAILTDTNLMTHAGALGEAMSTVSAQIEEVVQGESQPSQEG